MDKLILVARDMGVWFPIWRSICDSVRIPTEILCEWEFHNHGNPASNFRTNMKGSDDLNGSLEAGESAGPALGMGICCWGVVTFFAEGGGSNIPPLI